MANAAFAVEVMLFLWLFLEYVFNLVTNYSALPESMAVHFGFNGEADNWSSPKAWGFFFFYMLTAMGIFAVIVIHAGSSSVFAPVAVALSLAFGTFYSVFTQVLKINLGKQQRLALGKIMAWGVGMPVTVVFVAIAAIHLHR
jgi:hypothetical protein